MFSFRVESPDIIAMTVSGSRFGLRKTDPLQRHQLGLYEAPLYTLKQPFAPDEGWEVVPNPSGEYVTGSQLECPDTFPMWIREREGLAVLRELSSGLYLIVRCPYQAVESDYIYVGNEATRAAPNMRVLLRGEGPVDAIIVGAPQSRPPRLDCPLVGVVICHHTGLRFPVRSNEPSQHEIIFFSFCDGSESSLRKVNDLVLVIPVTGELVVDNLQLSTRNTEVYVPVEEDPSFRNIWRDEFARNIAEQLARPQK